MSPLNENELAAITMKPIYNKLIALISQYNPHIVSFLYIIQHSCDKSMTFPQFTALINYCFICVILVNYEQCLDSIYRAEQNSTKPHPYHTFLNWVWINRT